MAYEGDTPSTSSREGSEPHPPAREAQCKVQVSVPMEGSAQGGVKSKRGRPPQKPPRTHPGAQSQAATGLSTPGSHPEPRGPLPLRQHETWSPARQSTEARRLGMGAELHREESSRAGAGPGAQVGLTPPCRLQSEKASCAGCSTESSGKL